MWHLLVQQFDSPSHVMTLQRRVVVSKQALEIQLEPLTQFELNSFAAFAFAFLRPLSVVEYARPC
jgi:hypothetical protein